MIWLRNVSVHQLWLIAYNRPTHTRNVAVQLLYATLTCILLDSPDLLGSVLPLLDLLPRPLNLVSKSVLQNEI